MWHVWFLFLSFSLPPIKVIWPRQARPGRSVIEAFSTSSCIFLNGTAHPNALSTSFLRSGQYENLECNHYYFSHLVQSPSNSHLFAPSISSLFLLSLRLLGMSDPKTSRFGVNLVMATEFQDFQIFSVARFWQIHFALYNFIKHGQILAFIDMNPTIFCCAWHKFYISLRIRLRMHSSISFSFFLMDIIPCVLENNVAF